MRHEAPRKTHTEARETATGEWLVASCAARLRCSDEKQILMEETPTVSLG